MEEIKVNILPKKRRYSIIIGRDIISELKDFIIKKHRDKKTIIITDDTVNKLYGDKILNELKEIEPIVISIAPGEKSKSRAMKRKIEDIMLEKKYGRDTIIVAFGGGVIGDLAGYVASTYNRGVPYIQLPTSLLSVVDSSVGGKTGVNTRFGKNLIGSIWQPEAVFSDLDFIDNLPDEELLNGLGEIIKIAIILDKSLFNFIQRNKDKILAKEKEALTKIIKRAIELKRDVVEKDETEQGLRQILNFGHTAGHAIETYSGFSIKHGMAVSIGIAIETKIAVDKGILKESEREIIIKTLESFGLPTYIERGYENDKLILNMKSDKKAKKKVPRFILIEKIGKIRSEKNQYSFEITDLEIEKSIEGCKR